MPNWCKNKLSIYTTSDEQMDEFLQFVGTYDADGNQETVFSLDNIIPMPDELRRVQHPVTIMTQEEIDVHKEQYKDSPIMLETLPITQETCDALLNIYGVASWYDWAYENWGCKWDICNSEITDADNSEVYIEFDTPWGPPSEDIKLVLEARFEDINILWLWYEEGMQVAGYL